MDLRISVQSLVQQLVHEQAVATVNLQGLQRDVTTLLSFRDQVLDLGSLPRLPSPPAEPPWRPDRQPPWKGRDSGFSGSRDAMAALRTRPATTPSTPTPAAPSSSPILPPATPSVRPTNEETPSPVSPVSPGSDSGLKSSEAGSRWHDATHSGASGNSTSGVGTSVGAGISGGCVATSGDELLGLLDTIASRGRMIADENRQLAEVLSHTESLSQQAERDRLDQDRLERERLDHSRLDQDRLDQERSPDVTFRCRYCERPFPVRPGAGTDPTRLLMRDPVTDAMNMHVQMGGVTMGGQSPLLGGHGPLLGGQLGAHSPLLGGQSPLLGQTPHLGQSPLLGGHSPLLERQSPVLGGQSPYLGAQNPYLGGQPPLLGGQYLAGGGQYPLGLLTDTTPQHPGISTPLRRSPPPGAGCPLSLPTFRHPREEAIPALTELEKLIQERQVLTERLLGMELVAVRSQGQVASLQTRLHAVTTANEELRRQLRLNPPTLDSRLQDPSQHPTRQRRSQPSPAGASGVGAGVGAARSTPDLRPPSRMPQPMSLRRRPETGSEKDVSGRASGRSRYTQTESDGLSRDEKGTQTDQTGSVDESGGVASFRRQTDPERERVAGFLRNTDPGVRDGDRAAGFLAATCPAPVPDRDRVAGILRETDPLRLQRQLLRMLVEAEVLRSQLSALGRDPRRVSVGLGDTPPSAGTIGSGPETPARTQLTDRRPGSEDPSLSRHQPSEPPRRRPAPRPVDRSLGHSSIPVLVRSASPARGVARRRGSGGGGNGAGSGDGSGVSTGLGSGGGRGGQGSELATVRAIRLLPGTLRRSTPNLSTGEGQSYGRTDGPASQTGLQTSQAKNQASLTNGRASRTSGQTRNQSGLASQNITWANKTNSQTAYHNSRATNEPGNQASPMSNPTGSRSPDKPTQSPSASQPSPASQISTSTRLSAASPSSAPHSTGLSGSHQDPKTKGDWRVTFPNVTRSGNSSPSSPASSTSSPSRIPLPQSPGLASTALSASQSSPSSGSLARTAADIRALRRDMERRLRASRSDPESAVGGVDELATEAVEASGLRVEGVDVSSDGDADYSTTSGMTASETRAMAKDKEMETRTETAAAETSEARSRNRAPPQAPERRGGLLERLNALDSATATAGGSRFGYRHTGGSQPDPALMPPSQGLIHQILTAHTTPSQGSGAGGAGSDGGGNIGGSGGTTRRRQKLQKSVSLSPSGGQSPVAQRPRGSVSLAPSGGRHALTRSATLREPGSGQAPRQAPAKESGNARVGRYIRSLLQRISEVPDQ